MDIYVRLLDLSLQEEWTLNLHWQSRLSHLYYFNVFFPSFAKSSSCLFFFYFFKSSCLSTISLLFRPDQIASNSSTFILTLSSFPSRRTFLWRWMRHSLFLPLPESTICSLQSLERWWLQQAYNFTSTLRNGKPKAVHLKWIRHNLEFLWLGLVSKKRWQHFLQRQSPPGSFWRSEVCHRSALSPSVCVCVRAFMSDSHGDTHTYWG